MAYIPQSALDIANANLTQNLMLYLHKYLEIATGKRVECQSQITQFGRDTNSFIRFKCKACQDNWNVGTHLFAGGKIPTELMDWVEKHQHVCKEFQLPGPRCGNCQWPWDKHKEGQPYQDMKGDWIIPSYTPGQVINVDPYKNKQFVYSASVPAPVAAPAPPKVVRLTEVQGRKFRE